MAPSCPKERAELSPLYAGDSDINRVGDAKIVVEFDVTRIRPYVRFFEIGLLKGDAACRRVVYLRLMLA
jgi:hypothetical protein